VAFTPSLFNVTLDEIMARPADADNALGVPRILSTLTRALLSDGGMVISLAISCCD
jgi:hypothetical protein